MSHPAFSPLKSEPLLKIHILTDGKPELRTAGPDLGEVRNAVIGKDFHWHSRRSLVFPGQMIVEGPKLFNLISLEEYLRCVVASEMSPDAYPEFLKAHAIISRSWALGKYLGLKTRDGSSGKVRSDDLIIDWADESDHTDCHLCNDDHCQRYQGLPQEEFAAKAAEAVDATAGMVLTAKEGLVDSRFSKACGGRSEVFRSCWGDTDPSYLLSRPDKYCDFHDLSVARRNEFLNKVLKDYDADTPFDKWEVEVSRELIRKRIIEVLGFDPGIVRALSPVKRGPSGRLVLLRFDCGQRSFTAGKELLIRRLLSPTHLLSSRFDIAETPDGFRLTGSGWGHGVGLCQIGAARMASLGFSAAEILDFYYPHTSITKAYDV